MRPSRPKTSAFTLIELVLVMAIIAILAAAMAPTLRGFGTSRATNDTATLLVSFCEYARMQAVSEGRTYRVNFDPAGRSFWITYQDGGAWQTPGNDFGRRFDAADGTVVQCDVKAQPDGQYVEFHPSGRTDPARVTLTDKLGNNLLVVCPSATELFRIVPQGVTP